MQGPRAFVLAAQQTERERGWNATLTGPDGGVATLSLRAIGQEGAPPTVLDGLVAAALPAVMRRGGRLHVRGPVTHGALRQLTAFTEAWCNWRPARFARVTIVPETIVRDTTPAADHAAVIAWSGSLRSTHTLVRHLEGLAPGAFAVRAALRVLGLRAAEDTIDDATALAPARAALAATTVPLWAVRTNAATAGFVDPEIGPLPIVAAALHLVATGHATGLHARPWSFAAQLHYPRPAPALPDLLGGDACAIRADGGGAAPPRMAADVARRPALAAAGSDCRRRPRHAAPCGRCRDCALTALAFHAAGLPAPRPALRARPTQVATLPFADPARAADATAALDAWQGPADAIRTALATGVAASRAAIDARDTLRWLGSAAGMRPPWPR